jgi:predicted ATPase
MFPGLARSRRAREAELTLRKSVDLARHQGALFYELAAATALAEIWLRSGRHREANDLLSPVYAKYGEGFDTPLLARAKAALDRLETPSSATPTANRKSTSDGFDA